VVENANPDLKNQYKVTASNNQQGFTKAISTVFGI
jgi:hydroxymethylpyrimidine pyrophosphatase-like HAD family hydrolase